MNATIGAYERFFRYYFKHCVSPDQDTLYNYLNAVHSLNEKLDKAYDISFYEFEEFIALKALRNLFHHQEELINEFRIIPVQEIRQISTDLLYLCLIHKNAVNLAIKGISSKYRDREEAIIRSTFCWHGDVVNINPCIFNFSVRAFQIARKLNIEISSQEYEVYKESYDYEERNGQSHFVTGKISCHSTKVNELLLSIYKDF